MRASPLRTVFSLRLGDHRRACAKHNVTPDTGRYAAGRAEGLKSFCTYERGFAEGRAGHGHAAGWKR